MTVQRRIPNIYVVGAQCTGKTTLINDLASKLNDVCGKLGIDKPGIISEVARTVLRKHPIATEDIRASPDKSFLLQQHILDAQHSAEEEALARSSWFVSDRSSLDPIVYAKRYVSLAAASELLLSMTFIKLKERIASSSVVIVCEPGISPPINDGVRLMPEDHEDWLQFHRSFCDTLDELGLGYDVLPCSIVNSSKRAEFVINKWTALYIQS